MTFRLLCAAALMLALTVPGQAKTLFSDSFDSDTQDFAPFLGDGKWQSHYDKDGWQTDLNGGVTSSKDDGCGGNDCSCNFAVYNGGDQSDPYDNHLTAQSPEGVTWSDYDVSVRLRNADNDTIGVLFRYQNTANFYAVLMSRDRFPGADGCDEFVSPMTQIIRVKDGNRQVLAEVGDCYIKNNEHQLNIVAVGASFTVFLDGLELVSADDDSAGAFLSGGIGLFMFQNGADENQCGGGGCWFDDVLITEISDETDGDEDGHLDGEDNCPKNFNPQQLDYDQDGLGDACDGDDDNDGFPDSLDNCPFLAGADQGDFDGDDVGDACDDDDDNDGLPDALETGEVGDQDPDSTTDPLDPDTDGDGVPDGEEDANHNGQVDEGETDPNEDDSVTTPVDDAEGDAGATSNDAGGEPDLAEDDLSEGPDPDASTGSDTTGTDVLGDGSGAPDTPRDGNVGLPKPGEETITFGTTDDGCSAGNHPAGGPLTLTFLTLLFLGVRRRVRGQHAA